MTDDDCNRLWDAFLTAATIVAISCLIGLLVNLAAQLLVN